MACAGPPGACPCARAGTPPLDGPWACPAPREYHEWHVRPAPRRPHLGPHASPSLPPSRRCWGLTPCASGPAHSCLSPLKTSVPLRKSFREAIAQAVVRPKHPPSPPPQRAERIPCAGMPQGSTPRPPHSRCSPPPTQCHHVPRGGFCFGAEKLQSGGGYGPCGHST